jgi:hypothetical protein
MISEFTYPENRMTDLEIIRTNGLWIVVRGDKKLAVFKSRAAALWWIDSQQPRRRRQAGDRDAQNT